ncbi:hypothetical protein [Burkholderia phage BCSR52]|uniref:Uncharacterized protein n=1 Tax=Burkholderia phage BCSR52 TaxID=2805748 RepID=A0A889IQN9_9CAUD|nr:hypothetical protein [Burkholderia phage BCSR52]
MKTDILTRAQAKAIYDAMCALNNIGAQIDCGFDRDDKRVQVTEYSDGTISVRVFEALRHTEAEHYASQADFAVHYEV